MLPDRFGRYEVEALLGEGSMGRVFRAFDPLGHRAVALKTLRPEYLTQETAEEYLRRFLREARAAGALAHPNIITVFDVGEDYFVMELLEGVTLQALLRERGKLELGDALKILGPVAEALDYAHSKGTIHRDIKPANIMILPEGRPKIMDFGVAHLASTVMTASGQFLGSPSYMAPEQITKSEATPKTDLFSFGVVAYEMLTGQKPFQGDSITAIIYRVVNEDPPPPRSLNFDLPPQYDDIFRRAIAKDPAARYPNTTTLVAALSLREIDVVLREGSATFMGAPPDGAASPLEALIETQDLKESPGPAAAPAVKAPRAVRWRTGLAVGLAALALSGGVALYRRPWAPAPATVPAPDRAGIDVQTEPAGASVFIDGAPVGRSPLSLTSLAPGPHAVRVSLPGFAPAEVSLELPAGTAPVPMRFNLQSMAATLAIRSEPAAAEVRIDGKPVGATPLEPLSVLPGSHEVRLERKGYLPWSLTVDARPGESLPLVARLEPEGAATPSRPAPAPTGPPTGRPQESPRPWLREGALLDPGSGVTAPRRIAGGSAAYPEAARKLHLQGRVGVEMIVNENGEPTNLRVVESAGAILDEAVLEAVRAWRFEPAIKNGVKVRVRQQYRQSFEIRD